MVPQGCPFCFPEWGDPCVCNGIRPVPAVVRLPFRFGNKQDTLQPMTDEAPNPAKKTIRYSVKLQSDPQNGDLVSELRRTASLSGCMTISPTAAWA